MGINYYVTFLITTLWFTCLIESRMLHDPYKNVIGSQNTVKTIVVDQAGKGDFTKIQDAINSVLPNPSTWTRIQVNAGIYREQVIIDKPNIFLHGVSPRDSVIQWDAGGAVDESITFLVAAENFKAENLGFKNIYNLIDGRPFAPAPAIQVKADKASFHRCSFISLQDTLWDSQGRHFFNSCYIEGAIDFIWGGGQSIYQDCTLNFTGETLNGPGYITAQGRESQNEDSGFIFNGGWVIGTGSAYLGRAYRQYSTVVFNHVDLSNVVVPEGWSAWNYNGQEESFTYVENQCTGVGSDMSKRVKWINKFPIAELASLTDVDTFLNKDGWLNQQP